MEVKARGETEGGEAMGVSGPKGEGDGGAGRKDQKMFEAGTNFMQELRTVDGFRVDS